ncbi:unnamed protein product [Amoebophrya sp. A120]|nr:unnamed protein product [Amoebophrya sp. A120]|eukprot:GSA120T00020326001.1
MSPSATSGGSFSGSRRSGRPSRRGRYRPNGEPRSRRGGRIDDSTELPAAGTDVVPAPPLIVFRDWLSGCVGTSSYQTVDVTTSGTREQPQSCIGIPSARRGASPEGDTGLNRQPAPRAENDASSEMLNLSNLHPSFRRFAPFLRTSQEAAKDSDSPAEQANFGNPPRRTMLLLAQQENERGEGQSAAGPREDLSYSYSSGRGGGSSSHGPYRMKKASSGFSLSDFFSFSTPAGGEANPVDDESYYYAGARDLLQRA